ncbi:ndufa8, NADH-ubiquinone oxidoreductase complex I 19kd subunit [Cichlidogyrus casuarinus]|uniref:NADH dehydrogenase [ubiquinone] 1 alpha subcomplex subunit 8 n=1 Tax=Cichlidogyrus casuarinus TaxID=1844966 RepID=A0ABD2QNY8_9PLAT
MYPEGVELPSLSALEVPELKLSATPLLASAIHLGKYCDNQCKEFMLCNYETHDPRTCLDLGKQVTSCAFDFFRKVKAHCPTEFENYYKCLHKHGGPQYSLWKCRKIQLPFDDCIAKNLSQQRPELDFFNRVRLIETNRPKWVPNPAPMPERIPDLPDDVRRPREPKQTTGHSRYADVFI